MESKIIHVYSRIKAPQMRQILLFALSYLSNEEHKRENFSWKTHHYSFWSEASSHLEVILEDLGLDDNPEDKLGYVLVDQKECDVMGPLIHILDRVYDEIGPQQPDSAYLDSPLWEEVIRRAQKALDVFMANENKVKAQNPRHWYDEDDWDKVPV